MSTSTQTLTAKDIMTTAVVTLSVKDTVIEAATKLLSNKVSNAPVVDHDMTREILVGFVSEKDIMQCYAEGIFYRQPDLKVLDVMRRHPVSVREDADLYTLAAVFMQYSYRHVPVTKASMLQGIVSRRDVLSAFFNNYSEWQSGGAKSEDVPDLKAIFTPKYLVG